MQKNVINIFASRLPTLRLTTAIHSSRCLEAFHYSSAVSG